MLSIWQLFFTTQLLDLTVECTNDKAKCENTNFVTNRIEILKFIGVSILIGVYKGRGEPIRALWSRNEGRQFISQFLSRSRFDLITKFLRFDTTSARRNTRESSKFAPMGCIFEMWEQTLARPFIPFAYVTVDETLVAFRGRCSFRQYMPSKPAKYGLKFWTLCDAATGYCLRMKPYLGKETGNNSARAVGLGEKVVLQLTEKLDVGRSVVTDNFFSSMSLLKKLKERSLGFIGTMRKCRREIPPEFVSKHAECGSSLFGFHADATLVSYAPKKNKRVVLISSEHAKPDVDEHSQKPEIILSYNKGKGGVDHLDQMCAAYTTRKRTLRWPKCVFQHMIDVTAYNCFVLWCFLTGQEKLRRRQFLKMLGAQMCGGDIDDHGNICLQTQAIPIPKTGTRTRCRKCRNNKTVQRCQSCLQPLCINCACYTCPQC